MSDDERWREAKPPARGPSAPPSLHFSPVGTGFGVFAAVAIPLFVVGYTRRSGVNTTLILLGILIGILAGVIAGVWVSARGGRIWRGPQL